MKVFDIALKDLLRSFRSAFALVFMFGVPLLMTGMFYLMFGNIAEGGEFNLPRTKVIIANLDEGGPRFQVSTKNIPGGVKARTMGELVVAILQSEEMAELVEISLASSAAAARAAVDGQGRASSAHSSTALWMGWRVSALPWTSSWTRRLLPTRAWSGRSSGSTWTSPWCRPRTWRLPCSTCS